MDYREKILGFIKIKGPVLPVQISKEIGSDILMASAHLAELTATNKLKISSIKVGGSPLYYLNGQEESLEKYTDSLNDKEKKAFDLLKESKILRDQELEPVIRVALRDLKDFAFALNVNYNQTVERFWKWHLLGDNEAEQLIKSKLEIFEKPDEMQMPAESKIPVEKEIEEKKTEEKPPQQIQKQPKEKEAKKYKQRDDEDSFLDNAIKFFEKNKINVMSSEIIKKGSDADFIVEIPTAVGSLQYYCKAKNKKRISDSDLSSAYVTGQFKKLPVIFISQGDLSAKAREIIKKELNNLTYKKI